MVDRSPCVVEVLQGVQKKSIRLPSFQLHEPDPLLRQRFQLSFEGFARYLMDSANTALEVRNNDDEEEDMNQSMARYFIATSHNTYLVGHQLKGLSSVHLYREVREATKDIRVDSV